MLTSESKGLNWLNVAGRLTTAIERAVDRFAQEPNTPPTEPSVGTTRGTRGDYVPMTVESVGTHLYFWAEVNSDRCLDLIKRIRELDGILQNEREARMLPAGFPMTPIWLHIQSGGGELFTGLNIADQLSTIRTPIYSIVEGFCASAATLISSACTRRYITRSSFMLIHQLSSWRMGTYEQLEDDQKLNEMLMNRLYEFYETKTKIKAKEIRDLLRRDSWFDAEECVVRGLADEILR